MTGEDDGEGMSPDENDSQGMSADEFREQVASRFPHMVMNTGDRLRACDLAEAVGEVIHDGDTGRVREIVAEVGTAGETIADSYARMMYLLLAYIGVSVPFGKEIIARERQRIVDEEIDGISDRFGDPSE